MQYLYVRNWQRFQHYKYRSPPWIKLHVELLTSTDWVGLPDNSKLLAIVCMVVAARGAGKVPADPAYLKRVAYLDTLPNLKPLIECGFLSELLADDSVCKPMQANTSPENRVQRTETDKLKANGHLNGEGEKKRTPPRHGRKTRDNKKIWFNTNTDEWKQYAQDYRDAHSGIDPPVIWNGAGSWFNLAGEIVAGNPECAEN